MFLDDNEKKKKNYYNHFFLFLIGINFIFFISFKIFKNDSYLSPYSPKITHLKIKNGKTSKIGIISDFQLDKNHTFPIFKGFAQNVYKALTFFKKNNIDIIIIVGDTTNNGKIINCVYFKEIFYSVCNNIKKPILISLMGNHDYRDKDFSPEGNRKKFYKYMNSYPYSHYIINNYNFILWSDDNQNYTDIGIEDYSWIKKTIENARENIYKKGDPIFVITHMPPLKTVYGSENIWGHKGIFDFLKNYPEVICISGHSHYSLRNTKSIWQGEFTAINTQGLSYVDLDKFYLNYKEVHLDSIKNDSMGLVAYLNENNVIFDRIEFSTEEVLDERWKIDFPIDISNFKYNFEKRNKKIKPIFTDNNEIRIEKDNNQIFIVFNAGFHEDYVYIYKIILKRKDINKNDKKVFYYYSDYYKNKKLRKKIIKIKLPDNINKGKYDIEIYAIDSFDNISNPKINIIDI